MNRWDRDSLWPKCKGWFCAGRAYREQNLCKACKEKRERERHRAMAKWEMPKWDLTVEWASTSSTTETPWGRPWD